MLQRIQQLLAEQNIFLCGALSLADCTVQKPYLLERVGISSEGSVVIFAIPYHTPACEDPRRNLSRYAVGQDYHLFIKQLEEALLPKLALEFPEARFAFFSDHSPIDERIAAAKVGLGCLGKNQLLITKPYASYVFLGEIITDAKITPDTPPQEAKTCLQCGACTKACPKAEGAVLCLSALTQKKGSLSDMEKQLLYRHHTVWGCDICQEVCPLTAEAHKNGTITSPIDFFHQSPLPHLTYQDIESMSDAEFSTRAFSWRGKQTILRNLLVEKGDLVDEKKTKS